MNIHLSNESENINILISGGVDSTLLLYLVMKQYPDRKIICHLMDQSTNNKVYHSILFPIFEYLEDMFNRKILYHTIKQPLLIREAVSRILSVYPGVVLSGCNKVLYDEITPTVYIPGDTPPVRGDPLNEHHLRPFINLDKSEIINIYRNEKIIDLLNLTKSCGIHKFGSKICGGCYFCLEREWAFKKLNLSDINTTVTPQNI